MSVEAIQPLTTLLPQSDPVPMTLTSGLPGTAPYVHATPPLVLDSEGHAQQKLFNRGVWGSEGECEGVCGGGGLRERGKARGKVCGGMWGLGGV